MTPARLSILLALCLLLPASASAGIAIGHPKDKIELEKDSAALTIRPDEYCHNIFVTLVRDDMKELSWELGKVKADELKTVEWKTEPGNWYFTADVRVLYPGGREDEFTYTFDITAARKPELTIPRDTVDIAKGLLKLSLDQPLGQVDIRVLGEDLSELSKTTQHFSDIPAKQSVDVKWDASGPKPFQIIVRATDTWDYRWAEAELNPWALEIPHEDVTFATGSYAITAEESPKLDKAYAIIAESVAKYGSLIQVKLYIGGYTDTVGPASDNETLSRNRAKSIAAYFKTKGFTFPVYYQGFGERALAMPTPDSTDEPSNRRAVYLIAADTPLRSSNFPTAKWTKLP